MKYALGCRLGDGRKMRLFLSSGSFLIHFYLSTYVIEEKHVMSLKSYKVLLRQRRVHKAMGEVKEMFKLLSRYKQLEILMFK